MHLRTDLVYRYDGSYEGLMCCVYESFEKKEMPLSILRPDEGQLVLFPVRTIATDAARAERVIGSIARRISREMEDFVWQAFLTCLDDRELYILKLLRMAYKVGPSVLDRLTDSTVDKLTKAVRHMNGEAHLLTGFVRFSDFDGALASVIEPKNTVLPILAPHFCDRFQNETFLIYDKTHAQALIHQNGRHEIVPLESLELPEISEAERFYRRIWRLFYKTIGIEERYNPRCRMSHMPKRYWTQMTEFMKEDPSPAAGRQIAVHAKGR